MKNLLDRRLRRKREESGLPDLPEIRRLMRLSWWNGFTFGALERQVRAAHKEAFKALTDLPHICGGADC